MAFNYEEIIMEKENIIEELVYCLKDALDNEEDFRRITEQCGLDPDDYLSERNGKQ